MCRQQVVNYIESLTHETISDHAMDLFENGFLTSLDVLDLISFIENTYALQITGDDVDMHSFGSIDGMVDLICRLKNRHSRAAS
jgi:methoxymalonate biosynthesis acyl carrier protein